ncbi:MAG: biopolymer transporter ExbD [Arcobacteraceae bacterium]|nr:biopolymer transporter ExbD [Arcobacteraceae bacterium]
MKLKKFDSINVVPFIDIMLVLLVIVLTTATFVARGVIPLDLAVSKSANKLQDEQILNISINKENEIYFNQNKIKKEDIETSLLQFPKENPINISCDKDVKFDNFVYMLDLLKKNNYENLSIVTKNN